MGKTIRNVLALSCIATSGWAACPAANDQKEAVLCDSLKHFYNSEERLASIDFDRYIMLDPDSPVGYWRKLLAEYFAIREEQHTDTPVLNDKAYRAISKIAQDGFSRAETNIESKKAPNFNGYVAANILGIRAALQAKNESWWTARGTMIQAVRLARQSRYQDSALFLGTVNYKMSEHPFIRGFSGIPHDRESGRTLITDSVMQNTSPFVDDGWFAIFALKVKEGAHDPYAVTEIMRIWRYLYNKYPNNRVLLAYKKP